MIALVEASSRDRTADEDLQWTGGGAPDSGPLAHHEGAIRVADLVKLYATAGQAAVKGRILPLGMPFTRAVTRRLGVRNYTSDLGGATGIRTPDLLHAINHSPVPRPGNMRPDQATRELTHAATGPDEHPPAAFCPSECPSKCSPGYHPGR